MNKRLQIYKDILSRDTEKKWALEHCLEQTEAECNTRDQLYLHIFVPILINFTEWVLYEAKKAGIKRLYFLARDGYAIYQVAKALCKQNDYGLECRYLKVSRYSLRGAEYHLLGEECLDLFCIGGIDITFEKIMKRTLLTDEEARHIAELAGYQNKYTDILNYREIQQLKEILRKIPELFGYIEKHSKEVYPAAIGYFRQEGLFDMLPYAVVDSGWTGTTQKSLEHLINSALIEGCSCNISGYYFGLYQLPQGCNQERYHAYYFNQKEKMKRKAKFSNSMFEAVCSAPEGMTIGYKYDGNRYYPVESGNINPNAEAIRKQTQLLKEYLYWYIKTRYQRNLDVECRYKERKVQTEKLLKHCMSAPSMLEVEAFGEYVFCDDVLENQMQPVAAHLSTKDIHNQFLFSRILIMSGLKKDVIHESAWMEGSIVRNRQGRKWSTFWELEFTRWYKYLIYIRKAIDRK